MVADAQRYGDFDAVIGELVKWWRGLAENRGERAALRRCASPVEAVFIPAYHRLYSSLCAHGWNNRDAIAAIAALAARVEDMNIGMSLAVQMAHPRSANDSPPVSELRFRRLLKHQTRQDLYPALGRVIRRLECRVNLPDLAASVYWWGERVRKRWALDYYRVSVHESKASNSASHEDNS